MTKRKRNNVGLHVPMPDLFVECDWDNNPRILTVGNLTYSIRPDGKVECERTDHTCRVVEPPEELKRHVRRVTGKSYAAYVAGVVAAHLAAEALGRRLAGNRQ